MKTLYLTNIIKLLIINLILLFFIQDIYSNDYNKNNINLARSLFLEGKYIKSIDLASEINSTEAKIFKARAMSIYANFYLEGKKARAYYNKAYELSINTIKRAPDNDEAYVEAAHALGRYSQSVGVMKAISQGHAEKVSSYLDDALKINRNNALAHVSKGIWHAEIINKAGLIIAKTVYKAQPKLARNHFKIALELDSSQIGVLYEIAYGYSLLKEKEDLIIAKELLNKIKKINSDVHLDGLYKVKANNLKIKINS